MKAVPTLHDIAATWQTRLRPAERRALAGAWLGIVVVATLIARTGTPTTRSVAASLIGAFALIVLVRAWWYRRESSRSTLRAVSIVKKLDPALASQLARAVELAQITAGYTDRGSVELAELHLQRTAGRVPLPAVEGLAMARARLLSLLGNVALLVSLGFVLFAPMRAFEGFNVLFARGGEAPFPMHLVELATATVQPPAYLHGSPDSIEFESPSAQPRGSLVIVRGVPDRSGLHLVVTDGIHEVPFVSDGQGGILARYQLESTVKLRVAARFGRVLVLQRSELLLDSIPDQSPLVELDGAPKRVSIGDNPEVHLLYSVADDHGIRQVDLVLRAGSREDRRLLVRLDGETRQHTGAHVLGGEDAFFTNSYGPIEVRILARDDNNQDGSSWGQSEVITIDKPSLGQAQVRRRNAYLELRDQLVDWLAALQTRPNSTTEHESLKVRTLTLLAGIDSGGINESSMRKLMRSFLRAQRDKLSRPLKDVRRRATLIEEVTLSVDAAIETIAYRDAEQLSRLLGEVASEIEAAAKSILSGEQREQGTTRIRAAAATLGTGAKELKRLGRLGGDLGEIALAGWLRIGRAIEAEDLSNVERAASFLAERLRRPMPSFVGGGRAGVESGRRGTEHSTGAKASDAASHLERVASELQQLAHEHASSIEAVERLVDDSERGQGAEDIRADAKRHADEIRHLIEVLPPLGAEPGTLRASLALGRELARGAAESLERLQLLAAYEGLRKTDAALAEAAQLRIALGSDDAALEPKVIHDLRKILAEHRDWIRANLDLMRQSNLTKARDMLRQASVREREMAERATRLARRETQEDAVLPDDIRGDLAEASRWMQKASDALDIGNGHTALERQREAQNLLERNVLGPEQEQKPTGEKAAKRDQNSTGQMNSGAASIVSTSDVESREAFRRRVQQGLSREVTPELSPAVRRYAEGLLK